MQEIVLRKIKEPGQSYVGLMPDEPAVGDSFWLHRPGGAIFRTSPVQEIVDKHTFRTLNSIYKIERINNDNNEYRRAERSRLDGNNS